MQAAMEAMAAAIPGLTGAGALGGLGSGFGSGLLSGAGSGVGSGVGYGMAAGTGTGLGNGLGNGLGIGLGAGLATGGSAGAAATPVPFSDLLTDAVGQVNQLEAQAGAAVTGLMSGKGVDVHRAMIATEKASMAFELTLAVRNKAVQAYQSVIGMQF